MDLDQIYNSDARAMEEVDDNSIQLVVTSPPYNVGKNYNFYEDRAPLDNYLEFLMLVWKECRRILVPGGRIAVNIANTGRNPYLPLHAFIIQQFLELADLLLRQQFIRQLPAHLGTQRLVADGHQILADPASYRSPDANVNVARLLRLGRSEDSADCVCYHGHFIMAGCDECVKQAFLASGRGRRLEVYW